MGRERSAGIISLSLSLSLSSLLGHECFMGDERLRGRENVFSPVFMADIFFAKLTQLLRISLFPGQEAEKSQGVKQRKRSLQSLYWLALDIATMFGTVDTRSRWRGVGRSMPTSMTEARLT